MKNWSRTLVMMLVLGIAVVGCDYGIDDNEVTYKGVDLAGNEYTLFITRNAAKAVRNGQSEGDQGENDNGSFGKKGDGFKMRIKPSEGGEVSASGTITDIIGGDTLMLQTQDASEFTVTICEGVISSVVGEITLADGTVFNVRTFDTIYLRALRWSDGNGSGEGYQSGSSIKLKDIYNGTIDGLISIPFEDWYTLKISGNVDKEIRYLSINVFHVSNNEYQWTYLGGSYGMYAEKFGPGEFSSVEISFCSEGVDISTLPDDGEVILQLNNELFIADKEHPEWDRENGERIPDVFPEYGIWATLNNLTIEPVIFTN